MANHDEDRYEGKPLLKLIEYYILHAIEELSDELKASMEEMTPQLQNLYGIEGHWTEIIEELMELPGHEKIRLFALYQRKAEQEALSPMDFAMQVVDEYTD